MNMSQFAAKFNLDEDEFRALPYSGACELVGKYGYEFTGIGIVPIAGRKPRPIASA